MSVETTICHGCGATVVWCQMPSGKARPLDPEPIEPKLGESLQVAFDEETGAAKPITMVTTPELLEHWRADGMTFRRSHACPELTS